jgi:sialidase-1
MPDPTTAPSTDTFPGVSRLILVADEKTPRYSEGDVVQLKDGRLFLAVGRKAGASDFAAGEIIGMFSSDGGVTWDDEPHLIKKRFNGLVDLMSISFCRSPRGLHLFFLGRGKDAKGDTQPYQMLSTDEGKTWGEPQRVSLRGGYYVVNNARVIRTSKGRMLVPAAYVERIDKDYDGQSVLVLHSDDDGVTWRESNVLEWDKALMEPGVAECADGSIYMTIRTAVGVLYEARSRDGGSTWGDLAPTKLPSPAAPSTVVRAPDSHELWMFWCNNAKGKWKDRSPQMFAASKDHGRTWSEPRLIEHDPKHSYGYISFTRVKEQALLTYYDWTNNGQRDFHLTSLRQRTIPLAWLRGEVTPPVFRKVGEAKATDVRLDGLVPYEDAADSHTPDTRFLGVRVFRRRGFYLGLLHVLHVKSQTIQPEWAWSHTGDNWSRTHTSCIAFGDEGSFDTRTILCGDVTKAADELICVYRGSNQRHDGFPEDNAPAGRATLPLAKLDAWLDSLPQP